MTAQFPDYPDLAADQQRRKITVRHTLSMKMGTEWNEDVAYTGPEDSEVTMEMAADRYRYVLDRPMVHEPGVQWTYNGGATTIIDHLITKGTGGSVDQYAREKLFAPLGIETFDWIAGRHGTPSTASGLRLTIHDLAKIGRLVLNKGKWQDKQIVPAEWLEQSFTPYAKPDEGIRYGLFWWLEPDGDPPYWAAGFGNGGQRLMVSPGLDLIVVVLPVQIITEFVLPALR